MIDITAISDLHGYYPRLQGGDLLIVAGDLTAKNSPSEYVKFAEWLDKQNYKYKLVIAGNHDNFLEKEKGIFNNNSGCHYLEDSWIEIEGLKIWGSPWTRSFEGMNPECKAFTLDTEEQLKQKWDLIPDDISILVTHCPPFGKLDQIGPFGIHVGSYSLMEKQIIEDAIHPFIHVFGHIHECGGRKEENVFTTYINASIVNEYYEPVNKSVNIQFNYEKLEPSQNVHKR